MNYETLLLEREGDVGIVKSKRLEKMNAISNRIACEICEAAVTFPERRKPDIKELHRH